MIRHVRTDGNVALEMPITLEELNIAVKQGKKQKAPGCDGICHEFFLHTWNIIKDDLLS
jgi:hypothetical protein